MNGRVGGGVFGYHRERSQWTIQRNRASRKSTGCMRSLEHWGHRTTAFLRLGHSSDACKGEGGKTWEIDGRGVAGDDKGSEESIVPRLYQQRTRNPEQRELQLAVEDLFLKFLRLHVTKYPGTR